MSLDNKSEETKPQLCFTGLELNKEVQDVTNTPFFGGNKPGFIFNSPKHSPDNHIIFVQDPDETDPSTTSRNHKKESDWTLVRVEFCGIGKIIKGVSVPCSNSKTIVAETDYTYDPLINQKFFSCFKSPIPTSLLYRYKFETASEIGCKIKKEALDEFLQNLSDTAGKSFSVLNLVRILMTIFIIFTISVCLFGIILFAILYTQDRYLCLLFLLLPAVSLPLYSIIIRKYVRNLKKQMSSYIRQHSKMLNSQGISVELGKNCVFIKFSLEFPIYL